MIRVTIEVVPHGIEKMAKVIATGVIVNNSTGGRTKGNYTVSLKSKGRVFRTGEVKNFPRSQRNAWWLLFAALTRVL